MAKATKAPKAASTSTSAAEVPSAAPAPAVATIVPTTAVAMARVAALAARHNGAPPLTPRLKRTLVALHALGATDAASAVAHGSAGDSPTAPTIVAQTGKPKGNGLRELRAPEFGAVETVNGARGQVHYITARGLALLGK